MLLACNVKLSQQILNKLNMTHKLLKFNADTVHKTERAWLNDLNSLPDVFPGTVFRDVTFMKNNCNYETSNGNSCAYGVFAEDSHIADSIVQMVITKDGAKFVKMLDCMVRPSVSEKALKYDQIAMSTLVDIYIASIVGTLIVGGDHKANAVKVYGRTEQLLVILTLVASKYKELTAGKSNAAKCSIEGRWLVVKPTRKGK